MNIEEADGGRMYDGWTEQGRCASVNIDHWYK